METSLRASHGPIPLRVLLALITALAVSGLFAAGANGSEGRNGFALSPASVALDEILASFERRANSAASLDGLNINAVGTSMLLLTRLKAGGKLEMADRLQAALDSLDSVLLELPAFERGGPSLPGGGGQRRRRGQ